MTLHKSMWKAAVLMGIAGVLMFAGGALALEPSASYKIVCSGVEAPYGSALADEGLVVKESLKGKCFVISNTIETGNRDTIYIYRTSGTDKDKWVAGTGASFKPGAAAKFTFTKNTEFLNADTGSTKEYELNFDADMGNVTVGSMTAGDLENLKKTEKGNCKADVAVKSLWLTQARTGGKLAKAISELYDWKNFTTWLSESGKEVASGATLEDLGITDVTLKSGFDNVGKPYYRFVRAADPSKGIAKYDSVAVPTLPGDYDIYVSFRKGAANDSTKVGGAVADSFYVKLTSTGKLFKIKRAKLESWALSNVGDTAVVFSANGRYTLNGPTLARDFGVIDTIKYTKVEASKDVFRIGAEDFDPSKATTVTINGVDTAGKAFVLNVGTSDAQPLTVGGYVVTVTIEGRDPATVSPRGSWEISHTFKIGVSPKTFTDAMVSVLPGGSSYQYSGDPITGLVRVADGTRNLKQSVIDETTEANSVNNDFAVNFKLKEEKKKDTEEITGYLASKCTNAGPASVWVEGLGNYKGIVEKTFTIAPAPLVARIARTEAKDKSIVEHRANKTYDGTVFLDTTAFAEGAVDEEKPEDTKWNPKGGVGVEFVGLVTPKTGTNNGKQEVLDNVTDYVYTKYELNSANVGTANRTATIAVKLASSDKADNYILTNGQFTVTGMSVTIRDPKNDPSKDSKIAAYVETFEYSIPQNHYFFGAASGARRSIGAVTYQNKGTNPGAFLQVKYTYPGKTKDADGKDVDVPADFNVKNDKDEDVPFEGDTTLGPKLAGVYSVSAYIIDSSAVSGNRTAQHIKANVTKDGPPKEYGGYVLGSYEIKEPGKPEILKDGDLPASVSNRVSRTTTLEIKAVAKNYGTEDNPIWGTLSYRWFKQTKIDDNWSAAVRVGGNSSKLDVTTTDENVIEKFYVEIDNASSTFHPAVVGTIKSKECEVTPLPAPKSLVGQIAITSPDSLVYTGSNLTPSSANTLLSVKFNNGVNDNGDTSWLTLVQQTELNSNDGDYRLTYSNNKNVGTATILVSGVNGYTGGVSVTFKIVKRTLTVLDLAFTDFRPYTGEALGANVRPVVLGETGMGAITVTYNGQAAIPVEQGVYNLVASVAAGTNYTAASNLSLGAYEIGMGVLDSTCFSWETMMRFANDPNLPKGIGKVSFVKGTGFGDSIFIEYAGLTDVPSEVGPYPVTARILGGVNYAAGTANLGTYRIREPVSVAEADRQVPKTDVTEVVTIAPLPVKPAVALTAGPSPVKLGGEIKFFSKSVKSAIYIFDANGSSVAKLSAKPGKDGAVAVWNLKDKKGVTVSEGTYVAVAKDGREKVSFKFSVVK